MEETRERGLIPGGTGAKDEGQAVSRAIQGLLSLAGRKAGPEHLCRAHPLQDARSLGGRRKRVPPEPRRKALSDMGVTKSQCPALGLEHDVVPTDTLTGKVPSLCTSSMRASADTAGNSSPARHRSQRTC